MANLTDPWHVLAVKDASASSAYYQKLGFEEFMAVGENDWRFVRRGECTLMLGTCADEVPARETGNHSYFAYWHVDEIDALYEEWQAAGVPLGPPPSNKPWGMREFVLETPDGHRITLGKRL